MMWLVAGPAYTDDSRLAVVELFTSQGCYSCPPAEAYLSDLVAERRDVLALEFHVDYWDNLVYGAAGRWRDPFSDPSFTLRQRRYNEQPLKGRRGVYTPQMIVNGKHAAVGSNRGRVGALLEQDAPDKPLDVVVERAGSQGMRITVAGPQAADAGIWLARFDRKHETSVTAGENKGKTLVSSNVVRELHKIGDWRGQRVSLPVDITLGSNQSCAVLVQSANLGPILGVARCPDG